MRSLYSTADARSAFNFKSVASGESHGDHSIIDQWADNFNGVQIYRKAYVSAVRSGEFDVTYDLNVRNGDTELVLALGGSGLDISFTSNSVSGTYSTPSKPQGMLCIPVPIPAASGFTTGGAGGQNMSYGFATREGIHGASNLLVANQGQNWSGQRTDAFNNSIDDSVGTYLTLPSVSAWTDDSFTIAGGPSFGAPMAICGTNVRTAGGVLTQPAVTGLQQFTTGINARAIFFWSVGQLASTSVSSTVGQHNTGWATPSSQVGYWCGERMVGNGGSCYGVRYESDSSVLRFGTPEGAATVFNSVASLFAISDEGTATLNWETVDGTARQIIWFAIGEVAVPPVPPVNPIVGCVAALPN